MNPAHEMLARALEKIAAEIAGRDNYDLKAYVALRCAAGHLRRVELPTGDKYAC